MHQPGLRIGSAEPEGKPEGRQASGKIMHHGPGVQILDLDIASQAFKMQAVHWLS